MFTSRICSKCATTVPRTAARVAYSTKTDAFEDVFRQNRHNESSAPKKASQQKSPQKPRGARQRFRPEVSTPSAFHPDVTQLSKPRFPHDSSLANMTEAELRLTTELKKLDKKRISANEKLQRFEADLYPHLEAMDRAVPRHLYLLSMHFLCKVAVDLTADGSVGHCVPLIRMANRMGKRFEYLAADMVISLCDRLVHGKLSSADRRRVVNEVIDIWKLTSQLERPSQEGKELGFALSTPYEMNTDARSGMKEYDTIELDEGTSRSKYRLPPFTRALASIFLQITPQRAATLVPPLVLTICILSDPRLASSEAQNNMAPLVNAVSSIIGNHEPGENYFKTLFRGVHISPDKKAELERYVEFQWPKAIAMMADRGTSHSGDSSRSSATSSAAANIVSGFHKQLRLAYRSRNTGAIMALWEGLNVRIGQNPEIINYLKEDPEFLDFWVFVWCAIRRSKRLQEVLDLMKDNAIQPTVKTYTAMMHGWKICKDHERIEALWARLVQSPIRLDVVIWTERISALIEAGKPQQGIHALAEMLALWKANPSNAVQPTIEVVNAAFKGLLSVDANAAHEVLTWASKEGIHPNIRTYNIILRETFRANPSGVQDILKAMKNQNVLPDSATFTIILEEVLGSMEDASSAEQVQAVNQVFSDIQGSGLRANLETYAKMLYAVTSLANSSDEAVDAIQAHMKANNFSATPHMVTILIERALRREPPDMNAVKQLLEDHKLSNVSQGDQTLWERVMSAHAVTGDPQSAMVVFDDLAKAGRPVTSLPCLTDLLKALLKVGDLEQAKRVVGVVLKHKTAAREEHSNKDVRYWKHHFWFLAKDNKLIEWKDVPPELRHHS